jgi:hypothetical protein
VGDEGFNEELIQLGLFHRQREYVLPAQFENGASACYARFERRALSGKYRTPGQHDERRPMGLRGFIKNFSDFH